MMVYPDDEDDFPNDPCKPNEDAVACPTGDADGDGTPNGEDNDPNDPCKPDEDAVACDTGDADGDGTPNGQDDDPEDPCKPDKDVLACPTGDADDDGTPNGEDDDPNDPCKPDEDAVACDTGDADGDGTPNGDDDDPEDPCKPNPNVAACLPEFNFTSVGCDENTAVGNTCEVVVDLRNYDGEMTAFEFTVDLDQNIFSIAEEAKKIGATSSPDWIVGGKEAVVGFGTAINVTQTVQIARLTLKREDSGTTSITLRDGRLVEQGSSDEVDVKGRQRTLGN